MFRSIITNNYSWFKIVVLKIPTGKLYISQKILRERERDYTDGDIYIYMYMYYQSIDDIKLQRHPIESNVPIIF